MTRVGRFNELLFHMIEYTEKKKSLTEHTDHEHNDEKYPANSTDNQPSNENNTAGKVEFK